MKCKQSGFTLVEVLIAASIMSIIAMVLATLYMSINRMMAYADQKLESIELKQTIMQAFANSTICTWQLKDKVVNISANPIPTVFDLDQLYQGLDASSPVMVEKEKFIYPNSKLKVRSIAVREFEPTGYPNVYKGVIQITFYQDSAGDTILKPIRIQQGFTFNTTGGVAKISSCRAVVSLPIIKCKLTNVIPTSVGWHYHQFAATECGGVLPDASFVGMMTKTEVCGEEESWAFMHADEVYNTGNDFTSNFIPTTPVADPFPWAGPGVAFYVRTACPATPPVSNSNIEVTFLGTNF
jgi:prepilin-type N-terminal cleavage/methylation domain-containing protein